MVQLLAHATGQAMVISDSRVAVSQAEFKVFKAAHLPIWKAPGTDIAYMQSG